MLSAASVIGIQRAQGPLSSLAPTCNHVLWGLSFSLCDYRFHSRRLGISKLREIMETISPLTVAKIPPTSVKKIHTKVKSFDPKLH